MSVIETFTAPWCVVGLDLEHAAGPIPGRCPMAFQDRFVWYSADLPLRRRRSLAKIETNIHMSVIETLTQHNEAFVSSASPQT